MVYIKGVYNPPDAFYTQIDLPVYINPGIFIGRAGYYFKQITDTSGSEYIWYNDERKVIEVWGPEWSLPFALKLLRQRMVQFQDPSDLYKWYVQYGNHNLAMREFKR